MASPRLLPLQTVIFFVLSAGLDSDALTTLQVSVSILMVMTGCEFLVFLVLQPVPSGKVEKLALLTAECEVSSASCLRVSLDEPYLRTEENPCIRHILAPAGMLRQSRALSLCSARYKKFFRRHDNGGVDEIR